MFRQMSTDHFDQAINTSRVTIFGVKSRLIREITNTSTSERD